MRVMAKFLVLFLITALVSIDADAKRNKRQYFDQIELIVSFDITHPILAAHFLSNESKQLLIMGENKTKQRVASVYFYQPSSKSYQSHGEIVLPDSAIAFDLFTNHQGVEEMLLLDSKGLSSLNFKTSRIIPLVDVESIYLNPKPQFIARKKLVQDLNGDELDDIFVSNFTNRTLLLQNSSGEFDKNTLPIKAIVDMSRSDISFSEAKTFSIDVNFDNLLDLVLVENDQMLAFEQTNTGQFSSIANIISLPNNVSSVPWWSMRGADGESVDQSNLEHRMVETVEDINGDQIQDLMVKQTQSSGVLDRQNNYEIHYGKNIEGILSFNQDVDTKISAEGTLSGLEIIDINNDKRKEILVSSFDIGVSQIIGALLSGSIDQDVYLFSLDSADKYNAEPLFSEEVDLNFSLSSGSTGQPVILSADFDGDGFNEMLLSASNERLAIYAGKRDGDMFESRSKRHKLVLPQDGSMLLTTDLNNDKKEEVIVRYGKQDDDKLRHKVVILSAK